MNFRQGVSAWLIAFGLLISGGWFLVHSDREDQGFFENTDIALIGSSLMAYAVPQTGSGDSSLFLDGKSHRRIGMTLISEAEAIRQGETALASGVGELMIEVDPFIKGFANRSVASECDGPSEQARAVIWNAKQPLASAFRDFLGLSGSGRKLDEPAKLHNSQVVDDEQLAKIYPMRFHQPRCGQRLAAMMQRAEAQGVKVTLILPPRSELAREWIGPDQPAELRRLAEQLADQFGVPLFAPKGPWSNEKFVDQAHLNIKGRAAFIAELREWRAAAP